MRYLRLSTAQTEQIGPYLDSTDGVTEETALTPATEIAKDGAAYAAGPTGTHDAEGWYTVAFTTTHSNTLGSFMIKSQDSAVHLPVWHEFMVIPQAVYDALYAGTDNLEIDVIQWLGTAVATPTVAGVPEVDMTHLVGVTQSALDLKDFADDGYDPATNKVQGVVLVDTTTVNTDMRGTDNAALASVATEARLAELDPANLPADVDAILADTSDMQPKLGIPVVDISADIAAVKVDTAAILIDTADMQPKLGVPVVTISADLVTIQAEVDKIALADAGIGVGGSVIQEIQDRDATATAIFDLTDAIEVGLTLRQAQRIIASAVGGELSGAATTTVLIRNAVADTKDRITATVDAVGNRSAIVYDVT